MTNYNVFFNAKIDCEVQVEAESEEAAQEAAVAEFECSILRGAADLPQYDDFEVEIVDAQEEEEEEKEEKEEKEETCESAEAPIPDTTERVCILLGNPGEDSEDCTTHNHELP